MSIHTLMFGWEYPPQHLGGLGVACQGLVKGLLSHGLKVTLVLPHTDAEEDGADVRVPSDVHLQKISCASLLQPYDTEESFALRLQSIPRECAQIYGSDMATAIGIFTETAVETTKDVCPDIIHSHDWMTFGAGIRASKHHRKPLVAHIHATELDRTHFSPNEWIFAMEQRGFLAADRVIAVSNYTKNILVSHYGIPAEKITVIHNGSTDRPQAPRLTSLAKGRHIPMVLFLGRLVLQKGAWQFLEMARRIHDIRDDVTFVVAGDGPQLSELLQRTIDLGLADCTVFAGKVTSREARTLYGEAACFVMPSLSEPFGLVALEAIAHNAPIVISKQSGVSEVVSHCFAVDFWDTEKMADCVLTILREEPLAMQLRSEAPRTLQLLTWENQAAKIQAVYKDLIHT